MRKSIGDPVGNHHANATGTLMTLEAAAPPTRSRRHLLLVVGSLRQLARTVALSEDTTVCQPTTVYGASKTGRRTLQAYCDTYGMEDVGCAPFNAFGPREHDEGVLAEVLPRFVIRVMNGKAPIVIRRWLQRPRLHLCHRHGRWPVSRGAQADVVGQSHQPRLGPHGLGQGIAATTMKSCASAADIVPEHGPERPGERRLRCISSHGKGRAT